jgi:hypothetical protein
LERNESGNFQRRGSIMERVRSAVPLAALFGGIMTGVTALNIVASLGAGRVVPSLAKLGEIVLTLVGCFAGFGGLAFFAKFFGMSIFSRDE